MRVRAAAAAPVIAAVLIATLTAARAQPAPASARGRELRIVSVAPSATEILFALGAGDQLVGVCDFCDYPAAVERLPRVGAFARPSMEAIVALRPDLVIAARGPATVGAIDGIRRTGADVLLVDDTTLAAVWRAIADIGTRTGRLREAQDLTARMQARLDTVRRRLAGVRRRRVLMVVGQTPLIVAGAGTFVDDIIRIAGGINIASDSAQPWPRLSLEVVVAREPEVIIDSALAHEDGADPGLWARFPALPAVRDGHVHAYRSFAALRGGPRIVEAAEEFARLIHPERFATGGGTAGPAVRRERGSPRPARLATPAPRRDGVAGGP